MEDLKALHQQIQQGKGKESGFDVHDSLLRPKGRLYISKHSTLKDLLLKEFYDSYIGGHVGMEHTFRRLNANFAWEGMRKEVKAFVSQCFICQTVKYETTPPNRLLKPLPLPERVWEDVALDFIVGLPP